MNNMINNLTPYYGQETIRFLCWEKATRDTIDVKRCYIDLAKDLVAGILLSQIVYWHLPNDSGNNKLTINRDGYLWLAKCREDWWVECRISPKQFDKACDLLSKLGLVTASVFKFQGNPVKHVRLNWDRFLQLLNQVVMNPPENPYSPKEKNQSQQGFEVPTQPDITQNGISILTKGEYRYSPKGKNQSQQGFEAPAQPDITQNGISILTKGEYPNSVLGNIDIDLTETTILPFGEVTPIYTKNTSKNTYTDGGTPRSAGSPDPPPPTQSKYVNRNLEEKENQREESQTPIPIPLSNEKSNQNPNPKTESTPEEQEFRRDCKDLQQTPCQNEQSVIKPKRFIDRHTGKESSCSQDPWMDNQNPKPEFKKWLYQKQQANGWKNASEANAASEIRKDYVRAFEHWQEFLNDNTKRFQAYLSRLQAGLPVSQSEALDLRAIAPYTNNSALAASVMSFFEVASFPPTTPITKAVEPVIEAVEPTLSPQYVAGTDPIAEILKRNKPIRLVKR